MNAVRPCFVRLTRLEHSSAALNEVEHQDLEEDPQINTQSQDSHEDDPSSQDDLQPQDSEDDPQGQGHDDEAPLEEGGDRPQNDPDPQQYPRGQDQPQDEPDHEPEGEPEVGDDPQVRDELQETTFRHHELLDVHPSVRYNHWPQDGDPCDPHDPKVVVPDLEVNQEVTEDDPEANGPCCQRRPEMTPRVWIIVSYYLAIIIGFMIYKAVMEN